MTYNYNMTFSKPPRALTKLVMSLKRKKYRQDEKLSIAEGYKLIEEALQAKVPLNTLFVTQDTAEAHEDLIKKIQMMKIPVYSASPGEMERLSPLKTPPGILAVYRTDYTPPQRKNGLTVALYKISDPGNLGTIIRTADWFGASKILLSKDSAELHNPSTVRGSMGAVFRLPAEEEVDLPSYLNNLKNQDYKIVLAQTRGGQSPYPVKGKVVLVTSDELGSLPKEIEELADYEFTIHKKGYGESLNLASAVSILLYAITE